MNVLTRRYPHGEERHCTARCYHSTHKKCTCICKSLLHGKGEAYAIRNAVSSSIYLQLQDRTDAEFFPASLLVSDMQGR